MGMKSSLAVGVIGVAIVAGGAYWFSQQPTKAAKDVALASPPGILISTVKMGNATYVPGASSDQQADVPVFATPDRKTLYIFDKDTTPGKSVCNDECAKAWPAAVAPADAKPVGDWTVVTRDDGSKQWALKGKPVYNFVQDTKMGDYKGNGLANGTWHVAFANLGDGLVVPDGVSVQEVAEAGGQSLVDSHNMALYTFDGDLKHDKPNCGASPCPARFIPLASGLLANPVGDFTLFSRDDGVQQWAWQGKPLYTYEGDIDLGDANGKDLDKNYQIAMVAKYFMPSGVAIRLDERRGGLLVTADGKTLYARDRVIFNGTGGHNSRGGARGIPMIGLMIGASACNAADCEATWQPLKAAADAQPSGYWSLTNRADGSKQWAYQGYALYTFSGDKKAGDTNGHDRYDYYVDEGAKKIADGGPATSMLDHGLGMYWRFTAP